MDQQQEYNDNDDLGAVEVQEIDPYGDLESPIKEEVKELCERGEAFFKEGNWQECINNLELAASKLPEPQNEWNISCWLFYHIGESYYQLKDYEATDDMMRWAYSSINGRGFPGIVLRLGQSNYQLGNKEDAAEFLRTAYYEGGGETAFTNEDPVYLEFIKDSVEDIFNDQ